MEEDKRQMEMAEETEPNADGYFEIKDEKDGVYLTVCSPQGKGEAVNFQSVLSQIGSMGYEKIINQKDIMDVIKAADGEPTLIFKKPRAEVELIISRDKMEATLQIIMKEGYVPVTLDEVMEKIEQSGIVYGLSKEEVENAWKNPNKIFVIASGLKPENGTDAYIKYYIDMENKGKPVELGNNRVDYKNLNKYIIVEKNRMIAQKFPRTIGTSGMNVLGGVLGQKEGKDVLLPLGKNVSAPDGFKIIAEKAGHVVISNGKINVSDVIEIKEDIDFATGNIEFNGSVIVRGNVQVGFFVKAGVNVEIYGSVFGGIVEGENIIIRTGIQGMNRGHVLARGNIITKFIENANVYAVGSITVSDVILNSKVSAGKQITANGRIVGGTVSAGEKIRANVIGTKTHVNTVLQAGVNPELRDEYQKLIKEIYQVEEDLARMTVNIDALRNIDKSLLTPQQQTLFLRMTKAQFQLLGKKNTMKQRIEEIEKIFEDMKAGRVEVVDYIFPGSKVIIGTLTKIIMEPIRYSSFYAEDGDVRIGVL